MQEIATGLATGPSDRRYTSLLMGTRGSGKTVMLNEVEDMAATAGWVVLSVDAATPGLLDRVTNAIAGADQAYEALGFDDAQVNRSVEKKIGISLGPLAGSVAWSAFRANRKSLGLREHLAVLVQAAADMGTSVLVTVDEMHALDREEGRRLANELQHLTRRAEMPLAFLGAGLLEMRLTLMSDKRMTFFQRCEDYEMPPLLVEECIQGLHRPINDAGGSITAEALQLAAGLVDGSPYKLQLVGDQAWQMAGAPDTRISVDHVVAASVAADAIMDKRVGVPAWYDLSIAHQDALGVLTTANAPMLSQQVSEHLNINSKDGNKILSELRRLGYVVREHRGEYRASGLVSSRVVDSEWLNTSGTTLGHDTGVVTSVAARPMCRKLMPRAKAHCVLPAGHSGGCRSR